MVCGAQNLGCDWWRGLLINAVVGTSKVNCEQIGSWMSFCCKSWLKNRRRRRGLPRLWILWCKACEYSWRIWSRGTMKVCWLYCSSCRDKVRGHFSLLSLCSDIMPRSMVKSLTILLLPISFVIGCRIFCLKAYFWVSYAHSRGNECLCYYYCFCFFV